MPPGTFGKQPEPSPKPAEPVPALKAKEPIPFMEFQVVSENGGTWADIGIGPRGVTIGVDAERGVGQVTIAYLALTIPQATAFLTAIKSRSPYTIKGDTDIIDFDYTEKGHRFAFRSVRTGRTTCVILVGTSMWLMADHDQKVSAMLKALTA
jgi:hypothetical protein